VLINTPLVADLILRGENHLLKGLMKKSGQHGMKTFDQALYELYSQRQITYEDAISYADSANEVRLMVKLSVGEAPAARNFTLESTEDEEA
jgi:twitching motility protein PilU